MKTFATLTLTAVLAVIMIAPGYSQTASQTIGANPAGLALQGLSFVEYEKQIRPNSSIVFRFDHFHYAWEEDEYSYTYYEEGKGFGFGIGGKFYVNTLNEMKGFYIGSSVDFISVNWKWSEVDDYGIYYGDGNTTALALLAQIGYKAMISPKVFIEPSLIFGWASLSGDDIEGVGVFYTPSITLSIAM